MLPLLVVTSCGRKEKDKNGNTRATSPAVEESTEGGGEPEPARMPESGLGLTAGCTGEETTASLLNATNLGLAKLSQAKQDAIFTAQSRLPGERDLELSTAAHITNKLQLTAEIGEVFAELWAGDPGTAEYVAINALYGPIPSGDRLGLLLFGKAFYERVVGGTADGETVAVMGELLDALDVPVVDPVTAAPAAPVTDKGKVVALIAAIGTAICIN